VLQGYGISEGIRIAYRHSADAVLCRPAQTEKPPSVRDESARLLAGLGSGFTNGGLGYSELPHLKR